MNKINLGDEVKDSVSGFQGIAVSRHSYLQGCDRITVQPPIDKDGKLPDGQSFDEPQLVTISAQKIEPDPLPQSQRTGGPEKHTDSPRSTT